mmetsp:Transcript_15713/g.29666  ORF Transcript_15713/g.29666 Transcript_15713/m.29666 type:complete len:1405 (+) Transcript_15713:23-4237(+)
MPSSDLARLSEDGSGALAQRNEAAVCFQLDAEGSITGFSPNTKLFFHTSTLQGTLLTKLVASKRRKTGLAKFPPTKDIVEEKVVFNGRDEKKIEGTLRVMRMRDRRKNTAGYNVTAMIATKVENDGFPSLPEGYLLKKSSISSNKWQRRYFRARKIKHPDRPAEHVLDYFTDSNTHVSKGSIKLDGAIITTTFQPLVLVIILPGEPGAPARKTFLKTPTAKIRWQWASSLHKLSLYGLTVKKEAIRKEMEDCKKGLGEFNLGVPNRDGRKKATWRDISGRSGGAEGFQMSDLARLALRRMNTKTEEDMPEDIFGPEAQKRPYLNIQILSGRSLRLSPSSNVVAKVVLIGPTMKKDLGSTEIGFGPDPVFSSYEPILSKDRKMHNILAHVKFPIGVKIRDCDIQIRVFEVGALRERLLGEATFHLQAVPTDKIIDNWHTLLPRDKRRGEIKSCMFFEPEGKKARRGRHVRRSSSFSSFDASPAPRKKNTDADFADDPFASPTAQRRNSVPARPSQDFFGDVFGESNGGVDHSAELERARQEIMDLKNSLARAPPSTVMSDLEDARAAARAAEAARALAEQKLHKLTEDLASRQTDGKAQLGAMEQRRLEAVEGKKKAEKEMIRRLGAAKRLYDRELKGRKEAEAALAKLRKQVSDAGAASAKDSAALSALKDEISELKKKVKGAEADRESAERNLLAKDKAMEDAREAYSKLLAQHQALQQQNQALSQENNLLQSKVKQGDERISALEMENMQLKQAIEHLRKMLTDTQRQLLNTAARAERAEAAAAEAAERAAEEERAAELAAKADAAVNPALRVQLAMYARYFNATLGSNQILKEKGVLPLSEEEGQWAGTQGVVRKLGSDGLLIAGFLNFAVPNSIDERAMHLPAGRGTALGESERSENLALVARTCHSVGVPVGRTAFVSELLHDAITRPQEAADFLFALVSFHLMSRVHVDKCPDLKQNLDEATLQRLSTSPYALLQAWVPHSVQRYLLDAKNAGTQVMSPPSQQDLMLQAAWADLAVPGLLLASVVHRAAALVTVRGGGQSSALGQDLLAPPAGAARFDGIAEQLRLLGEASISAFLLPNRMQEEKSSNDKDVKVTWERANLLYAASLLEAAGGLVMEHSDLQETKATETAATTVWLNNLGLKGMPRVHDVYAASKDGLLLLRVLDAMSPGCVPWKKAEMNPNHKIKKISNCALAVESAKKAPFKFSLVGVGGTDIYSGNKTLTLSLLWQMRRYQLFKFLEHTFSAHTRSMRRGSTSRRKKFDESTIIEWANSIIKSAVKARGLPQTAKRLFEGKDASASLRITSMKDDGLATSLFYLLLLWANAAWSVNWRFVSPGATREHRLLNARYAITVARKVGVSVFVLPEDLVDLRPNMVLVFMGGLLSLDKHDGGGSSTSSK